MQKKKTSEKDEKTYVFEKFYFVVEDDRKLKEKVTYLEEMLERLECFSNF